MRSVPRRLVVLGGGAVEVELAQAVRRLGGDVVLVLAGPRVLPREPEPLGAALGAVLRRDRIELELEARVTQAHRDDHDYVLTLDDGRELRGDEAVPRVIFTNPHVASVGAPDALFSVSVPLSGVAQTATSTRAYAESNGFLTLLSDGERLTGAYALGQLSCSTTRTATKPRKTP